LDDISVPLESYIVVLIVDCLLLRREKDGKVKPEIMEKYDIDPFVQNSPINPSAEIRKCRVGMNASKRFFSLGGNLKRKNTSPARFGIGSKYPDISVFWKATMILGDAVSAETVSDLDVFKHDFFSPVFTRSRFPSGPQQQFGFPQWIPLR